MLSARFLGKPVTRQTVVKHEPMKLLFIVLLFYSTPPVANFIKFSTIIEHKLPQVLK